MAICRFALIPIFFTTFAKTLEGDAENFLLSKHQADYLQPSIGNNLLYHSL